MKKNFLSYRPAELIKGDDRWYVLYYHSFAGRQKRERPTFDLNRIKATKERLKRGRQIVDWLNAEVLPEGFTHHDFPKGEKEIITIKGGLAMALDVKREQLRKASIVSYESRARYFLRWVEEKGWGSKPIEFLNTTKVREFLRRYEKDKQPSPVTYNNNYRKISSLFYVLVNDKVIKENPFAPIKGKKVYEKDRRKFTDQERRTVYNAIRCEDDLLFLATLTLYWCLIRPNEMRQLKVKDFDLRRGVIRIRGEQSKNHTRTLYATIPKAVLKHYRRIMQGWNGSDFVWGWGWKQDPKRATGKNEMNRRHKLILERLQKENHLQSIHGLSFYSWKDTAVSNFARELSPFDLKDLGRWKQMETVLKYYHAEQINSSVANLVDDMILV